MILLEFYVTSKCLLCGHFLVKASPRSPGGEDDSKLISKFGLDGRTHPPKDRQHWGNSGVDSSDFKLCKYLFKQD